jgi:hypothetical protein
MAFQSHGGKPAALAPLRTCPAPKPFGRPCGHRLEEKREVCKAPALPGHENLSNLVCLVLKNSQIFQLGKELYDANVTDTTLFPGLDGFARSLWVSGRYLDLQHLRSFLDI